MAIASATDDRITVVTSDKGQKGDTGKAGLDGQGFNGIRQSLLDAPLCRLFTPNKLVDALAGSLTATRATTATYVDRYGIVKTAAIDEMREEAEGWLIEGASTNAISNSQIAVANGWIIFNATEVSTSRIGMDGSTSAVEWNNTAAGGGYFKADTVTANSTVTLSAFYKKGTTGTVPSLLIRDNATSSNLVFATYNINNLTASLGSTDGVYSNASADIKDFGDWVRLSLTVTIGADTLIRSYIYSFNENGENFIAWGAQLEELPFASSYIPTTGAAATRAADLVSAQVQNNVISGNQGDWSFLVNYKRLSASGTTHGVWNHVLDSGSSGNFYFIDTGGNATFRDMESSGVNFGSFDGSLAHSFIGSTSGNNLSSYLDGLFASTANITRTDDFNFNNPIWFGSVGANSLPAYGHFKDLRFYDFALNADEAAFLAGVK